MFAVSHYIYNHIFLGKNKEIRDDIFIGMINVYFNSFLMHFLPLILSFCAVKEEMTRAQVMILHGHQLAAGHHYASPLIVQRCNELRHHCDTLNSAISAKCKTLIQVQTLLQHLEEVRL